MKKLVFIIVVLLLLAGGGGGAYYYFVMMQQEAPEETVLEDETPAELADDVVGKDELTAVDSVMKKNLDYYVTSTRLNVRAYPDTVSNIRAVLQKGTKVTAKEIEGDWVRIGGYEVHESGRDMAQWVHISYLSDKKPQITAEERRKMTAALIEKSDDFTIYQDVFIQATQDLIGADDCKIEDFELLNGWVRSVTFKDQPVYFIYCGGTDHQHKIYLNVETGITYHP